MKPLLKLFLLAATLASAVTGYAQWSPPPPLETIDLPAVSSVTIVTGRIARDVPLTQADNQGRRRVEVDVVETLKGTAKKRIDIHLRYQKDGNIEMWQSEGTLLLVAIPPSANESTTIIDLAASDLAVFTADFKLLRKPEEIIQAVKDRVRATKGAVSTERFTRSIPAATLGTPSKPKGTFLFSDGSINIDVPVDERLERYAHELISAEPSGKRADGIRLLRYFKTDANIKHLQTLLRDDDWRPSGNSEGNKLYSFRINEVRQEAFILLSAWGIKVAEPVTVEPEDKNAQVVSVDLDTGSVTPADLTDLLRYPNLSDVSLANAKLNAHALDTVGELKALRMLYLQSSTITDLGLNRLAGLRHLAYLNLANTEVTDAGLLKLAIIKSLKKVDVGARCTEAGIDALRRLRPDLAVQPDEFAFLAHLQPRRIDNGYRGRTVQSAKGASPESWRYLLVFTPENAAEAETLIRRELTRRGWQRRYPGDSETSGYHRNRERLTGADEGWHVDAVLIPLHRAGSTDSLWGISSEPGGRTFSIERRADWTEPATKSSVSGFRGERGS